MYVTIPFDITPAKLTNSSAPEPGVGEVAWDNATSWPLKARVIVGAPAATVTISNSGTAAAALFTQANHYMSDGAKVVLSTTVALPAPLVAGQIYRVVNALAGTYNLSETEGGTPISTTSAGSGTHTATNHVHRVFESLVAANSGNPPTLAANLGVKWFDVGPTNKWAPFDLYRSTKSSYQSPYVIEIKPSERADTAAAVEVVADQVLIEVYAGAALIYSYSTTLFDRAVDDWRDYFEAPFVQRGEVGRFDLPLNMNAKIRYTFTRASGLVSVGGVVVGLSEYIGITLAKPEDDATNFSKVDRSTYGEVDALVRRRSVPKLSGTVLVEKSNWPRVRDLRDRLNAVPALWTGLVLDTDAYYSAVSRIGFYKRMSGTLDDPGPGLVTLALEVEEI